MPSTQSGGGQTQRSSEEDTTRSMGKTKRTTRAGDAKEIEDDGEKESTSPSESHCTTNPASEIGGRWLRCPKGVSLRAFKPDSAVQTVPGQVGQIFAQAEFMNCHLKRGDVVVKVVDPDQVGTYSTRREH
jgi:hypothetical protein